MATKPLTQSTGRRKEAVARVRVVPGSGQWKINGRDLAAYFPNKVHQQIVTEPFRGLGGHGLSHGCSFLGATARPG